MPAVDIGASCPWKDDLKQRTKRYKGRRRLTGKGAEDARSYTLSGW